jgi:quercetin dioxygenase-like cupin family protein
MNRSTLRAIAATVVVIALLVPAAAIASPGSGVGSIVTVSDGTLAGPINNLPDQIKLQTAGDVRVFTQTLSIAAGGNTGWHSHPGPVLVTVISGTFRFQESDCSFVDYGTGQTVLDSGGGHVHIGRNVGSGVLLLSVTYLIPPRQAPRIDVPAVAC